MQVKFNTYNLGDMLTIEELKNMNGQYIFIIPYSINSSEDKVYLNNKAKVIIKNNIITIKPLDSRISDYMFNFNNKCKYVNNGTWLDIYRWIKEITIQDKKALLMSFIDYCLDRYPESKEQLIELSKEYNKL